MDGLEATAAIRKDPRHARLPIIAMTAHALKGDAQRCLAAGMNAYVAKPVSRDTLYAVLGEHLLRRGGPSPRPSSPPGASDRRPETLPDRLPGLRIREARAALGLDAAVFRTILQRFARDGAETVAAVEKALKNQDPGALRQAAHALKGSAAGIGAADLAAAALALESAAGEARGDPAPLMPLLKRLNTAFDEVRQSLAHLVHPTVPAADAHRGRDQAALRPLVAAMDEALEMADPQEIRRALNAMRDCLDPEIWHELDDCIGDYEYDRARATLRNAAAALGPEKTAQGEDRAQHQAPGPGR